jgi:transcriptional regulator with XRE-family HTH domain
MQNKTGEFLKKRREELNLTLRDVQDKTGISNAYLSQIENGKVVQPTPSTLEKLAKCYDVPYHRLMDLAGHPIAEGSVKVIQFKTAQGVEELSEQEERELLDYLRFIRTRRRE